MSAWDIESVEWRGVGGSDADRGKVSAAAGAPDVAEARSLEGQ
jgi:hypothetical protein